MTEMFNHRIKDAYFNYVVNNCNTTTNTLCMRFQGLNPWQIQG